MQPVGFAFDETMLRHEPPSWHPDRPGRLPDIVAELKAAGLWNRLVPLPGRRADRNDVLRVHTREHFDAMERRGPGEIDPDTYLSSGTFEAALHAAGAVIEAVDRCRTDGLLRAFCAIRPPGHHAEADRAMGFCMFNNVAIGARYAQTVGYRNVFIVDFDAHHGNGTQHIFEEDGSVFYFSTHQHPFYPDTGKDSERGRGKGLGSTYNVPVPAGSGDKEYLAVYQDLLPGLVRRFAPDLVLVSAGYDIRVEDPHAKIRVTAEGIRGIVSSILTSAEAPVVCALEGGYDPASLRDSVRITVEEMLKR